MNTTFQTQYLYTKNALKVLNTQRCNKNMGGAFVVYTHYTFTMILTNQLWFELVLTVPMSKSSISTLSPGVDISMAGDGCWMGSSTCNVYNLLASQGLYYSWTLTGTGNKHTPCQHYGKRKQTQYDIISVPFTNKRHLGMTLYQHSITIWDNTWMLLQSKACKCYTFSKCGLQRVVKRQTGKRSVKMCILNWKYN